MTAKQILLVAVICTVHLSSRTTDLLAQTLADQPKAQRDAVRSILELGGDWEAPSKTVLVGFYGDKFGNEQFALLKPLVDLKTLALIDVPADDSALKNCQSLAHIESLQIDSCRFSGIGLRHLAQSKNLRQMFIEETAITDEGLGEIAKHDKLEYLFIQHHWTRPKITAAGVRKLAKLKRLKQLSLTLEHVPNSLESELQELLPDCRIWLDEFTSRN